MFALRRLCKRLAERPMNRWSSSRETPGESGPKDDDKGTRVSAATPSCQERDDDCSGKRGNVKVGIIGGGMAPIYAALLLKQSRLIKRINIVDTKDTLSGAVFDVSHIDTSPLVKHYGRKSMMEALIDVDIVALMDETDFALGESGPVAQLAAASSYVHQTSECLAQFCPAALVAVFARPVTATLPMVSEVYKCAGRWDPNRIVGSTALCAMRIEAMTASLFDLNPAYLSVPIAGGADPCNAVPLLTRARPVNQISPEHEDTLIRQLRGADKALVSSVSRFKGPSLSSGAAAAKFIVALASGLTGRTDVISSAYVRSDVLPGCRFFATELQFGTCGVQTNLGLPKVSPRAVELIEEAIPRINELSEMAINIVRNKNNAAAIKI